MPCSRRWSRRTTNAVTSSRSTPGRPTPVRDELAHPTLGGFVDPAWTERRDLAFAELYLDALERWNEDGTAPGPWQVAFALAGSEPRVPPIRHLLLGMNAHINFDLPQALLAVISDAEFDDPSVIERRATDHAHVDAVLASRVPEEDRLLQASEQPGDRTLIDRLMTPFNRRATTRSSRRPAPRSGG